MPAAIDLNIDANRSPWLDGAPEPAAARTLPGDVTADVAIIGGGFTGVSTAYHLSERFPDKKIVLLEARQLANGASGRNGGMMLNWINGVDCKDPEGTQRVFKATRGGIDLIEQIIKKHSLKVRYNRDGCLEVCTDNQRAEHAHARAEKLASWGIPVRYLGGEAFRERLTLQGGVGGILDPTAGQLNGVDLIRGMRGVLESRGVEIYEHTPVLSISEGAACSVVTPSGTVRARAIVLGTNGYTPKLGYFKNNVFPLHSHMIATEPLSPEAWARIGWKNIAGFSDDLDRIAYGSLTPSGSLLFGGGSNAAYNYLYGNKTAYPGTPNSAEASFQAIRERLGAYLPDALNLKISHRWTGTLGITMARVCSMGVRGEHKNVYYAVGYSGHGVTLANLAGQVLCDLYSDNHEPWQKLPFYQRNMAYIPPEPLRWVGYQLFTRLTGRSPRKVE
ncbi:MAG: FAD-dependent oxidoreductase [Myxococcales bacterium]|nr:FAD-dependent oxidoreductase [Myxococcales bacterium]